MFLARINSLIHISHSFLYSCFTLMWNKYWIGPWHASFPKLLDATNCTSNSFSRSFMPPIRSTVIQSHQKWSWKRNYLKLTPIFGAFISCSRNASHWYCYVTRFSSFMSMWWLFYNDRIIKVDSSWWINSLESFC